MISASGLAAPEGVTHLRDTWTGLPSEGLTVRKKGLEDLKARQAQDLQLPIQKRVAEATRDAARATSTASTKMSGPTRRPPRAIFPPRNSRC